MYNVRQDRSPGTGLNLAMTRLWLPREKGFYNDATYAVQALFWSVQLVHLISDNTVCTPNYGH